MRTYSYIQKGEFAFVEKEKPQILHPRDAIVRVTLASICSSDLHIKHGHVPRAVPGVTVGHEMVGIVEEVGSAIENIAVGEGKFLSGKIKLALIASADDKFHRTS